MFRNNSQSSISCENIFLGNISLRLILPDFCPRPPQVGGAGLPMRMAWGTWMAWGTLFLIMFFIAARREMRELHMLGCGTGWGSKVRHTAWGGHSTEQAGEGTVQYRLGSHSMVQPGRPWYGTAQTNVGGSGNLIKEHLQCIAPSRNAL